MLTLKFKSYDCNPMEQNYAKQASLPHFSATTDNVAVDLALWLLVLVLLIYRLHNGLFYRLQKKLGTELLMSAAPELIEVAMKKKSPNQAVKNTVTKTARKQLGGGRCRKKPMIGLGRRRSVGARKRKTIIRRKNQISEKSS